MKDSTKNRQDWKNTKRKRNFLDKKTVIRMARQLKLEHNKFKDFDNDDWEGRANSLTDFIVED